MKIASKNGAPSKLVPIKVSWRVVRGKFVDHTPGELTVRALTKALGSLIPKRGETGDGMQYFVKGPHLHLETFKKTAVGDQATYQAQGRVLVGRHHMPSDSHSEDVHAFSLTFKSTADRNGLPDLVITEGDINPLPRGATLQP